MAANGIAKILAIIGGLLVLIDGILALLQNVFGLFSFNYPGGGGFIHITAFNWINAAIVIVLGVLILITTGTLRSNNSSLKFNGITVLILGILALIFGSYLGPILVIIAGILLLI